MDEIRSRSRKEERDKRKEKTYDQYDWLKLAMEGSLKSLKVAEHNKYLESNGLTKTGRKTKTKSKRLRAVSYVLSIQMIFLDRKKLRST